MPCGAKRVQIDERPSIWGRPISRIAEPPGERKREGHSDKERHHIGPKHR